MKKIIIACVVLIGMTGIANAQSVFHEEWQRIYNGAANGADGGKDIAVDASGNIYVAGNSTGTGTGLDYIIIKYNTAGDVLWTRQYNGQGNGKDSLLALAIDNAGNAYVTGKSLNANGDFDFLTLKYSNSGNLQWAVTYDGTAGADDEAKSIAVDGNGNVYVLGDAENTGTGIDYTTIKYDTAGNPLWVRNYDGAGLRDSTSALTLDNLGNVIVTGCIRAGAGDTARNTATVKYDSLGVLQWVKTYNGAADGNDMANAITTDITGNIYITGYSLQDTVAKRDITTIKYAPDGTEIWVTTYNGPASEDDAGNAIAVDNVGNTYVCGSNFTIPFMGHDFATIKYDVNGDTLWVRRYDGPGGSNDIALDIALDDSSNVYVTGYNFTLVAHDYATIKYNSDGVKQWLFRFDGALGADDGATAIALDAIGNVYVTGIANSAFGLAYPRLGIHSDIATIKYSTVQIYHPPDFNNETAPSSFLFYENKGQLINTDTMPVPGILFYTNNSNPALYFKKNTPSYLFARVDADTSTIDTLHRIDMEFPKSNPSASAIASDTGQGYLNYYLGHCPQGITNVKGFKRLFIPDIYPNIDLHYYSNDMGLKYYFVVKPGGKVSDIEMRYSGADSVNINGSGNLIIQSSIGSIEFDHAQCYKINPGGNVVPMPGQGDYIQLSPTDIGFDVQPPPGNIMPIIIQVDRGHSVYSPTNNMSLEWSTYIGGSSDDECMDIKTNSTNYTWVGGNGNNSNFPVFPGPLVQSFGLASQPAFIAKFDQNAHPVWLSYFGGSVAERLNEIAIDGNENVYAVGWTASSDFPNYSSSGINYTTLQGFRDGFFIVFNPSGTSILCDSYIGGDGQDNAYTIDVREISPVKTIAIAGATTDITNFPVQYCAGAYNQNFSPGGPTYFKEAYIMRLDDSYNNVWCSLFGGTGGEGFSDVAINFQGNIAVCGYTTTQAQASLNLSNTPCDVPGDGSFPDCILAGAYNQAPYGGGAQDIMIVEFDNQNHLIWSTFFGGDGDDDEYYYSSWGPNEPRISYIGRELYIAGKTIFPGTTTFPILSSTFPNSYNQPLITTTFTENIFISRFDINRTQTWCTMFGGYGTSGEYYGVTDICEGPAQSVFITGMADADYVPNLSNYCIVPPVGEFPLRNMSGMNYMEVDPSGPGTPNWRSFIAAFNYNDNLIWSTRFGNGHETRGNGIAASNNKVFLAGYSDQVSTPLFTLQELSTIDPLDYYQPYNAGYWDGTISRFDISSIFTSVNENEPVNNNPFIIMPNPTSDFVSVKLYDNNVMSFTINLYDALGRLVKSQDNNKNEKTIIFDIRNLSEGLYFIQAISTKGIQYSGKFIKN